MWKIMVADHQKSGSASKRGVPKCPFGELYVPHFQTDDFFRTKSCGKQEGDTLRMTFETAWTPCYEVTQLMKAVYPSLRIFYKAEEPGNEVYLKNDTEGKYFPETESDGHPFDLMTVESEQEQFRLIRAIQEGKIKLEPIK